MFTTFTRSGRRDTQIRSSASILNAPIYLSIFFGEYGDDGELLSNQCAAAHQAFTIHQISALGGERQPPQTLRALEDLKLVAPTTLAGSGREQWPCTAPRKQMDRMIAEGYFGPVDRLVLVERRNGRLLRRVIRGHGQDREIAFVDAIANRNCPRGHPYRQFWRRSRITCQSPSTSPNSDQGKGLSTDPV